jgi:hypothetical protein
MSIFRHFLREELDTLPTSPKRTVPTTYAVIRTLYRDILPLFADGHEDCFLR